MLGRAVTTFAVIVILVGACLARGAEPATAPQDAPAWDPVAFEKLDAPAKLAFVRAALALREGRLNNFSYEVSEVVQNVDAKTREVKERVGAERHYGLRRLGEKYQITGIADSGYANDIPRRFWARWDGATYRYFSEAGQKNKATGIVRIEQHPILFYVEYNLMLGLRANGVYTVNRSDLVSTPLTLVQWCDHFIEKGKEATPVATLARDDHGKPWIELRVQGDTLRTWLYVFDPARQYMPTRHTGGYRTGKLKDTGRLVATDAMQVAGLWVPKRAVFTVVHPRDHGMEQERIYTVSHFTIGDVKRDDLKVDFGPGAEVVDAATHIAYHLDAQSKPTPRPLADVRTAKAYTPTEQELADALKVNPVRDDISDEAVKARKAKLVEYQQKLEVRRHADDPVWKKPAPAFPAGGTWHNSAALTWQGLKGKYVILHFHADWCGPCKNDYPMLTNVHDNARKGLAVIGMHVAGSGPGKVDKLIREYKLTYPICEDVPPDLVADPKANPWGQTFTAYGVGAIPHAILVGPDGIVIDRGTLNDVYRAAIERMQKDAAKAK